MLPVFTMLEIKIRKNDLYKFLQCTVKDQEWKGQMMMSWCDYENTLTVWFVRKVLGNSQGSSDFSLKTIALHCTILIYHFKNLSILIDKEQYIFFVVTCIYLGPCFHISLFIIFFSCVELSFIFLLVWFKNLCTFSPEM